MFFGFFRSIERERESFFAFSPSLFYYFCELLLDKCDDDAVDAFYKRRFELCLSLFLLSLQPTSAASAAAIGSSCLAFFLRSRAAPSSPSPLAPPPPPPTTSCLLNAVPAASTSASASAARSFQASPSAQPDSLLFPPPILDCDWLTRKVRPKSSAASMLRAAAAASFSSSYSTKPKPRWEPVALSMGMETSCFWFLVFGFWFLVFGGLEGRG